MGHHVFMQGKSWVENRMEETNGNPGGGGLSRAASYADTRPTRLFRRKKRVLAILRFGYTARTRGRKANRGTGPLAVAQRRRNLPAIAVLKPNSMSIAVPGSGITVKVVVMFSL